jgi:hypothetical protein
MYDSIAYRDTSSIFPNFGFGRKSKFDSRQLKLDIQDLDFEKIFLLNANRMLLRMCMIWCLFYASPLLVMLTECTRA